MGLHVSSVAELGGVDTGLDDVKYFIYFLNYYQFSDEIVDAFIRELPKLEAHLSRLGNAVLVSSINNVDFYGETLSWHNICGINPEEFGPSLLICTLPPSHFKNEVDSAEIHETKPWVLLPINQLCSNEKDLIELLQKIVSAIGNNAPLSDFELDEIYHYKNRPIITGKPRYLGVELDLKAAWKKTKSSIIRRKQPIRIEDLDD